MLVYFKEPMGFKDIAEYRVYGKRYSYGSFGPTDLPMKLYRENKDYLRPATYTKQWLDNKYKVAFPDVPFDINLDVPDNILKTIAELVGVRTTYGKRHELSIVERNALRRSILLYLSD